LVKALKTVDDLTPDARNANKGTVRGRAMIEASDCAAQAKQITRPVPTGKLAAQVRPSRSWKQLRVLHNLVAIRFLRGMLAERHIYIPVVAQYRGCL
jgi:hypothetical protein